MATAGGPDPREGATVNRRFPVRDLAAVVLATLALAACGDTSTPVTSVSGDAIPFNIGNTKRLAGATVWVLEHPEKRMVTGEDGHFAFDGIPVGSEATFVLEKAGYHLIQTGTHRVPREGLRLVTFQVVSDDVFDAFAGVVGIAPDPNDCQIATTVTRVGRSLYDPGAHGEAGATVTIDPPLPAANGPIYFNSNVVPDRSRTETSDDGGVVFVNVPPGVYVLEAHKPGVEFLPVTITCRAGLLVNSSPPWGLQALD